jgi:hypothetical protein
MGKSHDLATIADDGIASLGIGSGGLTVGTDQLAVDASGRVTMPYQPAFYAYMDATGNSYDAILTYYYSTSVNVGSHFNPNTGYFTAPVAGRYLFNANIMTTNTNTYHFWRFYQNSSAASSYHHTAAGYASYRHSSGCAVLDLQVNDTVSIYLGASALYGSSGGTPWSSFSGFLIG